MAYTPKKDEVKELREKLKLNPEGAYLFWGEEEYLKRHYLEKLRKIVADDGMPEFNTTSLDFCRDATLKELEEAVDSLPVMSRHNIIEVWGLDILSLKKEQEKRLVDAIKRVGKETFLVVFMRADELVFPNKKSRERSIVKQLNENLTMVEFPRQSREKLLSWTDKLFRNAEVRISDVNITKMIELCDYSMTRLKSESEKLIASCKFYKKDSVPNQMIELFVKPCAENQTYEFADAIVRHSRKDACRILENLRQQNFEPIVLVSIIAKTLNGMAALKSADKSLGDKELAELTGFFAWQIRKYSDSLEYWKPEALKRAIELCYKCDTELKSISTPPYVLVEALVISILG